MKPDIKTLLLLRKHTFKMWIWNPSWLCLVIPKLITVDSVVFKALMTADHAFILIWVFCTIEIWRMRKYDKNIDWKDKNDIWENQNNDF